MAKRSSPGAPAWTATFADLMSLLLAFFVLLFSFSELDNAKYKEVAGSMREAFGVQRVVRANQPPRGLNIVAQEFSPGMSRPTSLNEVRQSTTTDWLKYPKLGLFKPVEHGRAGKTSKEQDRQRIQLALKEEIEKGLIEIEIADQKIIVRVREKGSFPSGSERLEKSFLPVIQRLAETLQNTSGNLVISGHTDSIPIENGRFRSNWELSAARAASVAHVFLNDGRIPGPRVHLEAYADTQPVETNDSPQGRAKNRRVELTMVYGEDRLHEGGGTKESVPEPHGNPAQGGADE